MLRFKNFTSSSSFQIYFRFPLTKRLWDARRFTGEAGDDWLCQSLLTRNRNLQIRLQKTDRKNVPLKCILSQHVVQVGQCNCISRAQKFREFSVRLAEKSSLISPKKSRNLSFFSRKIPGFSCDILFVRSIFLLKQTAHFFPYWITISVNDAAANDVGKESR